MLTLLFLLLLFHEILFMACFGFARLALIACSCQIYTIQIYYFINILIMKLTMSIMSRVVLSSTDFYTTLISHLSLILTLLISFLAHCLVFILASFFIVYCLISQLFIIRMGQLTLLGVVTRLFIIRFNFLLHFIFQTLLYTKATFVVYPLRSTVY